MGRHRARISLAICIILFYLASQFVTLITAAVEGVRNRVAADIGDNVILKCSLDFPEGIPVPYVVQWQKLDNKIPIYIW